MTTVVGLIFFIEFEILLIGKKRTDCSFTLVSVHVLLRLLVDIIVWFTFPLYNIEIRFRKNQCHTLRLHVHVMTMSYVTVEVLCK